MENLDLIKEEFICLTDSPDLRAMIMASPLFFDGGSEIEFLERWPYGFVSYIDQDQKRLIYCLLFQHQEEDDLDSEDDQDQNLVDLLTEQNPANFLDLVYILTLYDPLNHHDSTGRIPPFGPCLVLGDDLFDHLFLESRGRLVYNHQLEMLYQMLTGCPASQAIKFRQSLGKKEEWAWMETELLRFQNGKTMKKVMGERMVDEYTFAPNYHGAMNLYECCFK
jgi:hypothetical protein